MARLVTCGFELGYAHTAAGASEGEGMAANAAAVATGIATTNARINGRCLGININSATVVCPEWTIAGVTGRNYYLRFYYSPPSVNGTTDVGIAAVVTASWRLMLTSDRKLRVLDTTNNTQVFTSTQQLTAAGYYRIEVRFKVNSVANTHEFELRLDGTTLFSSTTMGFGGASANMSSFRVGHGVATAYGAAATAYWDDVALNDDQGAYQNDWCGPGHSVMLLPTSDDTANSNLSSTDGWKKSTSTTTNLYDAINDIPPAGAASPSLAQITCVAPTTSRYYRCNLETLTAKSVPSNAVIKAYKGLVVHGESVATGTKQLDLDHFIGSASNISGGGVITSGGDAGAVAAFQTAATLWRTHSGYIDVLNTVKPNISWSSATSMRIRGLTSTRNSDVCFMGINVEYDDTQTETYPVPTRLYLPSVGSPSVTPSPRSEWSNTASRDVLSLVKTKSNSTHAWKNVSATGVGPNYQLLLRTYVSPALKAQTLKGLAYGVVRGWRSAAAIQYRRCMLSLYDSSGAYKGSLYTSTSTANWTSTVDSTDFQEMFHNTAYPGVQLSVLSAVDGDFLVLDIGESTSASAGTYDISLTADFGDNSTDAVGSGVGGGNDITDDPWIEFSQPLLFQESTTAVYMII